MKIKSINPATGEINETYLLHTFPIVNDIINSVDLAQKEWVATSFIERSMLMRNAAKLLRKQKPTLAQLITHEMGKVIRESEAEVEKSALVCDYYADNAKVFLSDEVINSDAKSSFVAFEPLGVILAVMPWNFPFWQVFRFAAPALMAGNAAVLKHASNVPGCSVAIEKIFTDSGFPENLFRSLLIPASEVENIIGNKIIKAVILTGSESAGRHVAKAAGKHLKKTVLELGGSDPFIVFKDADLNKCSEVAVMARMINTGQSCIAAKRFIVVEEIADEFIKLVSQKMSELQSEGPMDPRSDFGPLARPDLLIELQSQIDRSVKMGAKIELGGNPMKRDGFYFEPTIISKVTEDMPVFTEETFGPVMAIVVVENEEKAIELANKSNFGLGASIWTQDRDKGIRLARKIEAGAVFINGLVKSDPRLPFGGIKNSGYGRELSNYGIKEFVNIKTIWVG
ncbi:MAG TPA: NAD-dependent succinate-semialdehyde dehydrogenase [Bacteroidales bacterium]|nr:NAD-dependent succinate-semialdehyde dehydrogenase [Bacteroidales bacterium]